MPRGTKTTIIGLIGATLISGSAMAGGFSRGSADTDILYEAGGFVMRNGVAYVMPQRGYDTIGGVAATDPNYSDSYIIPSFAGKLALSDNLSCAGTYTQPFGAKSTYGPQAIQAGINADLADSVPVNGASGTSFTDFTTDEFGVTCGYRFNVGRGNLWILGGGFLESISYEEGNMIGDAVLGTAAVLSLTESSVPGYRIGAAYEIPEIALRVQGMYRSAVEHSLTGTFSVDGLGTFSSVGAATMPQSFELKAQSGIAPGWLAFGSVTWTDWSVLQTLNYTTTGPRQKEFFYQDGWTVSGGVGHAFNDMISGSLSFTWNSGVSTTEDVNEDTFGVSGGISVADSAGGQLRLGGGITYLTGGSVAQAGNCGGGAPGDCGDGPGGAFAYTVGNDWAFALGASYKRPF
ncbi:MAG: long-chain fatty acid transporter [Ahrensia sp.]|nr:long-chain fatty acid transporter [Ahrensia sp.]